MKKYLGALFVLILFAACGDSTRNFVRASGDLPAWIASSYSDDGNFYFSGSAFQSENLERGKDFAYAEAVFNLMAYIGIAADVETYFVTVNSNVSGVESYFEEMVDSVNVSGSANISLSLEEIYSEYYDDGTVDVYVLISSSEEAVEKAREEIEAVHAQIAANALLALEEAKTALEEGDVIEALTKGFSAYHLAAESFGATAVYLEAGEFITALFSQITLRLDSEPVHFYEEGGSDNIAVTVLYRGEPVSFMTLSYELEGEKNLVECDESGRVVLNISPAEEAKKAELLLALSIEGLLSEMTDAELLLAEFEAARELSALKIDLSRSTQKKAARIAVFAGTTGDGGEARSTQLETDFSEILMDAGYTLSSVNIPSEITDYSSVLEWLSENDFNATRLFYIQQNILYLSGTTVGNFKSSSVTISVNLVDISSGETLQSFSVTEELYGMTYEQAAKNATAKALETISVE